MKKSAFTLSELLVVVLILGVLSAVVLPKYNKVVESNRITEAETVMQAVRQEQEARCTLNKNYTVNPQKIASWPKNEGKSFDYDTRRNGMIAVRNSKGYVLQMPSYEDGRICCDNCENLNRNIPRCNELKAQSDYVAENSCAAPDGCEEGTQQTRKCGCSTQIRTCKDEKWGAWQGPCESAPRYFTRLCSEAYGGDSCGTQKRTDTCDVVSGEWQTGAWTGTCNSAGPKIQSCRSQNANTCGMQTRTASCDNTTGQWKYSQWLGSCNTKESETLFCNALDSNTCGIKTRTASCEDNTGKWSYSAWSGNCAAKDIVSRVCPMGCGTQTRSASCNAQSGWSYSAWSATCVPIPNPSTETQQCGCENSGTQSRNYNTTTCAWNGWESCSVGACKDCPANNKPESSQSCGCENSGTQTRSVTCNRIAGVWNVGEWGACSVGACKDCTGTKPATSQSCGCNNSGTQTRSVSCNRITGTWSTGGWSQCSVGACKDCPANTKPATSQSCGCNNSGTQSRSVTCNTSTGTWSTGGWGGCSVGACKDCPAYTKPTTSQSCGCNGSGTQSRSVSCNQITGTWSTGGWGTCSVGACQTCSSSTKPATSQSCGCTNSGTQSRSVTCNTSTGTWSTGGWGNCSEKTTGCGNVGTGSINPTPQPSSGKKWSSASQVTGCIQYSGVVHIGHGTYGCDSSKAQAAISGMSYSGYSKCPSGAYPGGAAPANAGTCWYSGSPSYTRCYTDHTGCVQTGSYKPTQCPVQVYSYACWGGVYVIAPQ